MAGRILDGLEARGWGPEQAAGALFLSEAKAVQLGADRLKRFSVARLAELLALVARGA